MPKVTEAHLEARRQQILNAACTCFSGKGFYQTTMKDICLEAHLSPGAVYRYFRSKEEIIRAMCEQSREQSAALIEEAKRQGSTLQVLSNLADAFFSLLDRPESQAMVRLQTELWAEALHNPSIMELLRRDLDSVCQTFTGIVQEGQERGGVNPEVAPEAVARVLISLFHGLFLQKSMDRDLDVLKYVAVVKAMGSGLFCPCEALEVGDASNSQWPRRMVSWEKTNETGVTLENE